MMSKIISGFGRQILDDHKEQGDWYVFTCPRCGKLLETETQESVKCCDLKFSPDLFSEVVVTEVKKNERHTK